ncbi:hypothetical protein [Saccharicrinis fermentans]|uniref:hypothetical protein n=1 Tax=Saccharicrinis fermentans TaxID=982 RepID=UPI0004AD7920|nr:hypothetical protein [Saccharicrinis fermentans]
MHDSIYNGKLIKPKSRGSACSVFFAHRAILFLQKHFKGSTCSRISTCDVNPREWLTDVLSKFALYRSNYDLDLADLLPHNWKKSNSCQNIPKNTH